jgi:hypothetical protein
LASVFLAFFVFLRFNWSMKYETVSEVFKAFPLAVRKDYGGFVIVAFQSSVGVWSGRAWRACDWKRLSFEVSEATQEGVFSAYRLRISTLKDLLST